MPINTRRDTHKTQKPLSHQLKKQKTHFAQLTTLENQKLRKNVENFFQKMFSVNLTVNPEESSMIAKLSSVSIENR